MTVKKGHEMTDQVSHTEAVLAFVHETKTWRDMETDERLAWCQRVAHVLSVESNGQFGEWSQTGLAPVLGISRQAIGDRLAWSDAHSAGDPGRAINPGPRSPGKQEGDARRFFTNPGVVGERKAAVVVEALVDDYVAAQVADRIASDPDLLKKVERAQKVERRRTESHDLTIDEAWTRWLNELNTVLVKGARLAERMEREDIDPGVIPQAAFYAYQLITEKKLDAEIRTLFENEEVH